MNQSTESSTGEKKKWLWTIISSFLFVLLIFAGHFAYTIITNYYLGGVAKELAGELSREKGLCPTPAGCPPEEGMVRRLVDGVYVKPGEENLYPYAVIIDNHPLARPPAGLSQANLVFEAEVEGKITRLLAVFAGTAEAEKIGSVRSIRPYFVDWANEFSALLVHSGGSPEALQKISDENIFDFNEFSRGGYFWRDNSRPRPHHIFTSSRNLKKYLAAKARENGKFVAWQFKDDLPPALRPADSRIEINYGQPDFLTEWKYDRENNLYRRYVGGKVYRDASGAEISAKNIIVEYVPAEIVDAELRFKMSNLGTGRALVCLDGSCREGEWRKKETASRSRFFDKSGQEFKFNAGTSWIEVVRPTTGIVY